MNSRTTYPSDMGFQKVFHFNLHGYHNPLALGIPIPKTSPVSGEEALHSCLLHMKLTYTSTYLNIVLLHRVRSLPRIK